MSSSLPSPPIVGPSTDIEDQNIGVNQRTPPVDLDKLREDLHEFAVKNAWRRAKAVFDEHSGMVRTRLAANGDRVLHIAVRANSSSFVQHLVDGKYMSPADLEIQNDDGNTAFGLAAISGNATLLKIMMGKNRDLPLIHGQDGMLPVHLAASSGCREIVPLLSSDKLLEEMKKHNDDFQRLFLMTIRSGLFEMATKLFEKDRVLLAIARADDNLTALHILAQKPSEFSSSGSGTKLFGEVLNHVGKLESKERLDLITTPSIVLFDAIESGNDDVAILILKKDPSLLTQLKDSDKRGPLHYAALYRRGSVLTYMLQQRIVKSIIRDLDSQLNNFLHLAASYQSLEALSRLDTEMQRELAWFKGVEEKVPLDLRTMKNREGKRPKDVFYATHRELSKEVRETVKGICNSGMLVAALIAAVVFAAAVTVPGDKTSAWFVVFILTNAVALYASSASIIFFLSIFTSAWFRDKEFVISQVLIKQGLVLLFISVVAMVMSFAAASFLIFGHIFKWVACVVVSMGVLPILLLLDLQSKCFNHLLN